MLDKQDYMRACVCTPPLARAPARKRTRARTRRQMCNTFPRQQWFANAPQYYVIRTLPALLSLLRITCTKCWRFIKHQCNRKICVSCLFQLYIQMWKNYSRYFCVRMENTVTLLEQVSLWLIWLPNTHKWNAVKIPAIVDQSSIVGQLASVEFNALWL
jgi:hypothetical protein